MRKPELSIVIPVYNSQETIKNLVDTLIRELEGKYKYELVLVNDGSQDNSYDICKQMAMENEQIKFLTFYRNFGQANAILAGFHEADGDIVIVMDDDLQNPPSEIHKLIACINDGNEFAYGKPKGKMEQNLWRRLASYLNVRTAEIAFKKPKGLYPSSYYALRADIVKEVIKYNGPFPYISGLVLRITRNGVNVPVEHHKRRFGTTQYNFTRLVLLWLSGITNFSILPLRLSSFFGSLIAVTGFLYLLIILIQTVLYPQHYLMGWPSVVALIVFFAGVQLFSLGIVGEYIGRIFLLLNNTPQFVVRERYNCDE